MTDFSERKASVKRQFRSKLNLDNMTFVYGDTDGTINNPYYPGRVWVQVYAAGGLLGHRSVFGPSKQLPLTAGTPVRLKRGRNGRLEIDEIDRDAIASTGVNPTALIQQQNSSSTPQSDHETLRCVAQNPASMTIGVKAWNPIVSGTVYQFGGSTIDLSSPVDYIPGAGDMCFAVIAIKSDYATLEVTTSTARPISDFPPLGTEDTQEAVSALSQGSTPIWAIKLTGATTVIAQQDIDNDGLDLRQEVNTSDGTYSATASTTDATVTTLYSFTIPASTTYAIEAKVVARRTGGASGTAEDGAFYVRYAAIKNAAGTATLIGSVASIATMEDQVGWDCTIDVTGATARIRITGAASNNIDWASTFAVYKVT